MSVWLYLAVGLLSGAVITLQITVMRIFSVGNWAHFGSFIVSVAMLGIGIASTLLCINQSWVEKHWRGISSASLLAFGPIAVATNLLAQQVPFNAIFLISDPMQKWRLALNFLFYLTPFVTGSLFLGAVFLKVKSEFAKVYFADLVGCGLCSLTLLVAMYFIDADNLLVVPLALWTLATACWALSINSRLVMVGIAVAATASFVGHLQLADAFDLKRIHVSDYKGISYAQKFPDSKQVFHKATPFGQLDVYSSSYLHFAPGLSDNASLNLTNFPKNAYLGLYVDGDGPTGVLRNLSADQEAYFDYLPMSLAYATCARPDVFVVEFAGGLSTVAALSKNARSVTVADNNPAVFDAFLHDATLRSLTGDVLNKPQVKTVKGDGRVFLSTTSQRYDLIDLSLADSAGLSSAGGFAIVEKYDYTKEAMSMYMKALKPGGVLSVTLWNKEDPPKSTLRLYATMFEAAREINEAKPQDSFFVLSSYLGTTTVLYQKGGLSRTDIETLEKKTAALSFDEIYAPGKQFETPPQEEILAAFRAQLFGKATNDKDADEETGSTVMPAVSVARLAWKELVNNDWARFAQEYVYDIHPLTNDKPYFAAYLRPSELPQVIDRLEMLQDEWGYILLWATLIIAIISGFLLIALPAVFGWRALFAKCPGKAGTLMYFACLGLGYIMVEVSLISHFTLALSHTTVSATVLITGMLAFSGFGSLFSQKVCDKAGRLMPWIFASIAFFLILYGFWIDSALNLIAELPYDVRLPLCLALICPPAFLMGIPMPVGMTSLARVGKESLYLWAWGINGCASVIGAALVPILATSFGLSAPLTLSGILYLLATLGMFAILKPALSPAQAPAEACDPLDQPLQQTHPSYRS